MNCVHQLKACFRDRNPNRETCNIAVWNLFDRDNVLAYSAIW